MWVYDSQALYDLGGGDLEVVTPLTGGRLLDAVTRLTGDRLHLRARLRSVTFSRFSPADLESSIIFWLTLGEADVARQA